LLFLAVVMEKLRYITAVCSKIVTKMYVANL